MNLPLPPLLIITDRQQATLPLETVAERVFAAGCRWISLREKDLDPTERLDLLRRLVSLGRRHRARVFVHDDIESAHTAGAHGLHLPAGGSPRAARQRLGLHALIGISTHSVAEIREAQTAGADYVTLSPIFESASKPDYGPPLGLAVLTEAAQIDIPVLALGGVTAANAGDCLAAGASGLAVMGPIMRADDPQAEAARILAAAAGPHPDPPPLRGGGRR